MAEMNFKRVIIISIVLLLGGVAVCFYQMASLALAATNQTQMRAPLLDAVSDVADRASRVVGAFSGKNVPVDVYLRVLDDNGDPVPGVKISYEVRHSRAVGHSISVTRQEFSTVSGMDGSARLVEGSGDVVSITGLKKDGYGPDKSALRRIGINAPKNDPSSKTEPIVLHMWRGGFPRHPSLKGGVFKRIPIDGDVHSIKVVSEFNEAICDLKVSAWRNGALDRFEKGDWGFQIAVDGGEIREEKDPHRSLSILPTGGFSSNYGYRVSRDNYQTLVLRRFFFRIPSEGNWGNLTIMVNPKYPLNTAALDVQCEIYHRIQD